MWSLLQHPKNLTMIFAIVVAMLLCAVKSLSLMVSQAGVATDEFGLSHSSGHDIAVVDSAHWHPTALQLPDRWPVVETGKPQEKFQSANTQSNGEAIHLPVARDENPGLESISEVEIQGKSESSTESETKVAIAAQQEISNPFVVGLSGSISKATHPSRSTHHELARKFVPELKAIESRPREKMEVANPFAIPSTTQPLPEAKASVQTPAPSINSRSADLSFRLQQSEVSENSSLAQVQTIPFRGSERIGTAPHALPADKIKPSTYSSQFYSDSNSVDHASGFSPESAWEMQGERRGIELVNSRESNASERIAALPAGTSLPRLPTQDDQPGDLAGTLGSTKYLLAEQPKAEDQYHDRPPLMSGDAFAVPYSADDFAPDPMPNVPYDPYAEQNVYSGKKLYANQRPLVEIGKPWYQLGQIAPGKLWFGRNNPVNPQFLVYGDYRTGAASNVNNGNQQSIFAARLNLDFDLRLTSTERFHWFMGPLDRGANFTRIVHDAGETRFISEFDPDIDFGYFEGDAGAIWGGLANKTLPFDMPFAMGVMPLLFQNGVWMEDAFLGWAATIPARNSPTLDISNMDITFFAGYDKVTTPAFAGNDHDAKIYGMASFIEAVGGYIELDYAFLEDRSQLDRSYHNSSVAYTRRYGRFISNSTRVINNAGQSPNGIDQTADGTVLLFENSLISGSPLSFVPYFNGFVGFDRPQSAARAAAAGGVLRNTGILFETDGLTGYPTLDATANNTYGAAMGLNIIAKDFSQQLILEAAMVQPFDGKVAQINGQQYGLGLRYQLPLSNSVILRCDSMYGINASDEDIQGYRVELRKKW